MEFLDRILKCCDCSNDFVFTAGEQLFFSDKQFKNDPKRCKLCKAKRAGLGRSANAVGNGGAVALPLSRTETKTECSACGVETTVPFKPTQGRPVLCRSCFQLKRVPSAVAAVATMDSPAAQIAEASAALESAIASGALDSAPTLPVSVATVEQIADTPNAALDANAGSATAEMLSVDTPQA